MNHTHMFRNLALFALATLLIGTVACEDSKKAKTPEPFADLVASFDADLAANLEEEAARRAGQIGIRHILGEKAQRDRLKLHDAESVLRLYSYRDSQPIWVDSKPEVAALSPEGESLYAALLESEKVHGLWLEDYHVERITELLHRAGDSHLQPIQKTHLSDQEKSTLSALLVQHPQFAKSPRSIAEAIGTGELPVPRLQELVKRRVDAIGVIAESKARLDLLLTDALVAYGTDMTWRTAARNRSEWPTDLAEPKNDTAIAEAELANRRLRATVDRDLKPVFESPAKVHETLAALPPAFDQYGALTKAFQTYSEYAEKGGWQQLDAKVKKLRVGRRSPLVVILKERLAAEGYWSADDTTDRFSKELRSAVIEYQRTHQLWEEGWVTPETLASMNVEAERRRDQIRVTLERWRESRVSEDVYVHVNIPDFHAEVWENGKRQLRFRVVTGSSARQNNTRTQEAEYVNATPQISGRIQHVVFNPFWNVPNTILNAEILPKQNENPLYLAENSYEWATDDFGEPYLRQKPGPQNALGQVKFMFPNKHHVFLHDTNEKQHFRTPVRAKSHGCVRVENPMELAKYLLDREGKWNDDDVKLWLERDTETWIKLDQNVPVHIEYYVVRVDGVGRANFLADVYREDTPRVAAIQERLKRRADALAAKPTPASSDTAPTAVR